MRPNRIAAALAALLSLQPAAANALAACTASATGVSFGSYDPLSPTPRISTGSVTVSCDLLLGISLLVAYSISLSQGNGTFSTRQLSAGPGKTMNYNLFTSGTYGSVWGNGSGGSVMVYDGYLLGLAMATTSYPIYGRIPALQNVPAGNYTDTILVTVTY
ncbi:spore coat U domain-containing protein [Lacibacterium aquatile]|uniref:Spore coat U domain-containing protein n=1 Tax=Lacibacterium aquatile TaxID=1168082 RepID=A0ABW5DSM8_9PROT